MPHSIKKFDQRNFSKENLTKVFFQRNIYLKSLRYQIRRFKMQIRYFYINFILNKNTKHWKLFYSLIRGIILPNYLSDKPLYRLNFVSVLQSLIHNFISTKMQKSFHIYNLKLIVSFVQIQIYMIQFSEKLALIHSN